MLEKVGVTPPAYLTPPPPVDEFGDEMPMDPAMMGPGAQRPRTWPIILFFAFALGGPWLIWRLLRAGAEKEDKRKPVKARAVWAYQGQTPDELSFQKDDVMAVYPPKHPGQYPQGWVLAGMNGQRGLVPANRIRLQQPTNPDGTPGGDQPLAIQAGATGGGSLESAFGAAQTGNGAPLQPGAAGWNNNSFNQQFNSPGGPGAGQNPWSSRGFGQAGQNLFGQHQNQQEQQQQQQPNFAQGFAQSGGAGAVGAGGVGLTTQADLNRAFAAPAQAGSNSVTGASVGGSTTGVPNATASGPGSVGTLSTGGPGTSSLVPGFGRALPQKPWLASGGAGTGGGGAASTSYGAVPVASGVAQQQDVTAHTAARLQSQQPAYINEHLTLSLSISCVAIFLEGSLQPILVLRGRMPS